MPTNPAPDSRISSTVAQDRSAAETANRTWDVQDLVTLARDKSKEGRSALVTAIDDLFSGQERLLTGRDRVIMFDILRRLIHDVEVSVRRRLADRFADQTDVPQELVTVLANDEIDVAYPILVKSELLRDEELIEIVQHRAMEHQVAIAMRAHVSEPVSDALVKRGNEEAITTLLSNEGARISDETMGHLVEESRRVVGYQQPLAYRRDLSPHLVKKLYLGVSAALRQHIATNFDLDTSELDQAAEAAVSEAIAKEVETLEQETRSSVSDGTDTSGDLRELIQLLRDGKVFDFLDKFTALTRLRVTLARRLLFEAGGEGLAIACHGIGLDKHHFASIFLRFRQGRLGDKRVEENELRRALEFFDQVSPESAKAILRRWQQDVDYQNALRLAEESEAG